MKKDEYVFSDRFIRFLNENGTNVNRVHKKTKIPLMTLYDWKNGKTEPKIGSVAKITKEYELPSGYFIE